VGLAAWLVVLAQAALPEIDPADVARRITPKFVVDKHVPWVALLLVVVLGLAPAVPAAAQTDDRVQAP